MFHYESHFAKAVHQIAGVILVIFTILHIIVNWKALVNSLKGRLSVWVVILVFLISIVIMVVTGEKS